jgi:PAS domain S-box-containing protein
MACNHSTPVDLGLELQRLRRSEEMLRCIFENILDIVAYVDEAGNIELVSPSCKEILGVGPDELINQYPADLIHPDDLNSIKETYLSCLKEKIPFWVHARLRHADGNYHWLAIRGNPVRTGGHETSGMVIVARDMTERFSYLEKLKSIEEELSIFTEQSIMGVYILQDGVLKYVNNAAAELTGYSREEITTWEPGEFIKAVHVEDRQMVEDQVRKKLASSEDAIARYRWRLILKSGEIRWVESYSKRIDYQGNPAIMAVITDVTEQRSMEEERAQREEKLKEFIDIASHELRHPITIIRGYTLTLAERGKFMDENAIDIMFEIIDHAADRLNDLVNRLFDVSSIDKGNFQLSLKKRYIDPVVEEAVAEMRARGFSNDFAVSIQEDLPECRFDRLRIKQILINLLDNAVKFSPARSPIEIDVTKDDDELLVRVMDRGIGIPEEARELIFQRFYQVEKAQHHSLPGMGMGLYISEYIVRAHGGKMWSMSRPGGGTIMCFTLPCGISDIETQEQTSLF